MKKKKKKTALPTSSKKNSLSIEKEIENRESDSMIDDHGDVVIGRRDKEPKEKKHKKN